MKNANHYKDEDFRDKVLFYVVQSAIAVMEEPVEIKYHEKRVEFAKDVLRNNFPLDTYVLGVMGDVLIKEKIDANNDYDDDLAPVVDRLFSVYAGGANEES